MKNFTASPSRLGEYRETKKKLEGQEDRKDRKEAKEEIQELEMEEYGIEKCKEKLTDYITNALKRGYSSNRIKDLLNIRGWSDKIVVSFINDIKKSSEV